MGNSARIQLTAFNQCYKEMDILYHNYARQAGLSDSAFWILYCISEHNSVFTQRDLCNNWFFTPQTVNSALKDMERHDIITLEPVPGNKKNKSIQLTQTGILLVQRVVLPLMQAEQDSFAALSESAQAMLLRTTQAYVSILKNDIFKLMHPCEAFSLEKTGK